MQLTLEARTHDEPGVNGSGLVASGKTLALSRRQEALPKARPDNSDAAWTRSQTLDHRKALLLWHFNRNVARFAHPSWLPPAFKSKLPSRAFANPACSEYLLEIQDLSDCDEWIFKGAAKRFFLLEGVSLSKLMLGASGLLFTAASRRLIRSEARAAMRLAWPGSALEVMQDPTAPLLGLQKPLLPQSDQAMLRLGARLLLGLLPPDAKAVRGRARLRLPQEWALDDPLDLSVADKKNTVAWISKTWIPERSPAWAWLF